MEARNTNVRSMEIFSGVEIYYNADKKSTDYDSIKVLIMQF